MFVQVLLMLILQQTPAAAVVDGRVFDAETGAPLKNARVRLSGGQSYDRVVATDDKGNFAISDVDPGTYNVRAEQTGYLTQMNRTDSLSIGGNFPVKAGGHYPFEFALIRAGSISGRLLDNNRQPIADAQIQLLGVGYDNLGRRTLETVNVRAFPNFAFPAFTNKQGEYRFNGVSEGDYYVQYSSKISSTYYPGVSRADEAIPIHIMPGADIRAIDFSVATTAAYKASGTFVNPFARGAVADYEYVLVPRNARLKEAIALTEHPELTDNRFTFEAVPPGSYDLYIGYRDYVATSYGSPLVGHATLDVLDRDVTDLLVEIHQGIEVKVEIHFDEGAAALKPETLPAPLLYSVDSLPVGLGPNVGTISRTKGLISADGGVIISDVASGRYRLDFPLNGSKLYVSAARFGTQDILGQPLEIDENSSGPLIIELSASGAAMEGTVTTKDGIPAAGAQIWLVPPLNRRQDRSAYLSVSADAQGRFRFNPIAPGIYTAFAFAPSRDPIPVGAIMNAEFMTPYLNYGLSIDLPKGETVRQDLTLITAKP